MDEETADISPRRMSLKSMKKIIIGVFLSLLLIGVLSRNAVAALSPTPTSTPLNISSFELFWPVVAGKTIDDPLYILKSLKEKVRGFLIFGKPQKADYNVFLATKRVVEAEKLISEDKRELAVKTLDKAIVLLESAETELSGTPGESISSDIKNNINKQLKNLEIFVPRLMSQDGSLVGKLQEVLNVVKTLNSKI